MIQKRIYEKKSTSKGKSLAFNVSMLYIMNIAKLVFPLITLPYLTRVLSVDCYGVVSYVKATMVYAQLVVDFGFMLSGVKAITEAREDRELVGRITGNVILAKVMLSIASLAVIVTGSTFYSDLAGEYAIYDTGIYSDRTVDTFAGILIPRA